MNDIIYLSPLFLAYCPIPILSQFGVVFFGSFINKTKEDNLFFLTAWRNGKLRRFDDGTQLLFVGRCKSSECFTIHQKSVQNKIDLGDSDMVIVHSVPESFCIGNSDLFKTMSLSIKQDVLSYYVADFFLDYLDSNNIPTMSVGFGGTPLWNINSTKSRHSTIVQGAKCLLGENFTSYLLVINGAVDFDYSIEASLNIRLLTNLGECIGTKKCFIKPFSFSCIQLGSSHLASPQSLKCFNIIATSKDAALFPFVIGQNLETGSMFMEHGMPPHVYAHQYSSRDKLEAICSIDSHFELSIV